MRWILFTEKFHVRVGLCRYCLCSLGSPELPRQSYLHPHLCIYPDYLLFCRNMYSSRTKIESCEFSLLNTCQNQYWNITGMGNSTDTKYLLKHLFRMLTLSILWTTDDPIRQEDVVCCRRPGVARLVRVKSAVGTAGLAACLCSVARGGDWGFTRALRGLWRSGGCWVPWCLVLGDG